MTALRAAALYGATGLTGLSAGLLAAFAVAVLPGLRAADSRTLVLAMRSINSAIVNPVFAVIFFGPLLLGALALVLSFGSAAPGPARWWLLAAVALYLGVLLVTFAGNIPLNNALDSADVSSPGGIEAARNAFADNWIRLNMVRTVLGVGSLAAFIGAVRVA